MDEKKMRALTRMGELISRALAATDHNNAIDYGYYIENGDLYITYPAVYCALPRLVTMHDYNDVIVETFTGDRHASNATLLSAIRKVFGI